MEASSKSVSETRSFQIWTLQGKLVYFALYKLLKRGSRWSQHRPNIGPLQCNIGPWLRNMAQHRVNGVPQDFQNNPKIRPCRLLIEVDPKAVEKWIRWTPGKGHTVHGQYGPTQHGLRWLLLLANSEPKHCSAGGLRRDATRIYQQIEDVLILW